MGGLGDGAKSEGGFDASSRDAGRYEVFATLGRGGMAEVFLAVSRGPKGFNKLVVLKKLRAHLVDEPSFRQMFLDEARLAARLNHANVVQSYEVGERDGSYFIAMEYLDGQPLNRLLEELRTRGERLDPAIAARIAADASNGLAHAHELADYDGTPLQIIHRDISPHNIFVTYDGQVKLVDFGIAKAAVSQARTDVGVLKGKVNYMAPEQALGGAIDSRADLFAMGVVLWEMIVGRRLFDGENAANTLHRLMNEPLPTPSSVAPGVDPALETIVMRALAKNPDERFASARELRATLDGWLQSTHRSVRGEEVGAVVSSRFETVRAQVQKKIRAFMTDRPEARAESVSLASLERAERVGAPAPLLDLGVASGLVSGLNRKSEPGTKREDARRSRMWLTVCAVAAATVVACLVAWVFRAHLRPAEVAAATPVTARPVPAPEIASAPTAASAVGAPPPTAEVTAEASSAVPTSEAASHPAKPPVHPSNPTPAPRAPTPAVPASASPGYLTLDTYPWTRVTEGGHILGTTPLVHFALSPGAHSLVLENTDLGILQSYTATITSGETLTRRLGLR
ncbi:MAG TPA: protein kinase [Polyangiaceae bacterium]|jgi:serine/threonine-protein kinase